MADETVRLRVRVAPGAAGDEIAGRIAAYQAPAAAYTNGVLGKYRMLVGSAAEGAVTG